MPPQGAGNQGHGHSGTGFALGEAPQEPDPHWCCDWLRCWIPQPGVARAWSQFAAIAKGGPPLPDPCRAQGWAASVHLILTSLELHGRPKPCVFMWVCVIMCMCVLLCTRICVHVCTSVHACLCACMSMCMQVYVCTYVSVCMRVHVCACLCVHVSMRTRLYARVSMCVCTELQGQEEPCSRSRSLQLTLHPGPACTYPRHSRRDVTLSAGSAPALRVPVAVPSSCLSAAPVSVRAAAEPVCYFQRGGTAGGVPRSHSSVPGCPVGAPCAGRSCSSAQGRNQQRPGEPGPAPGGAEPPGTEPPAQVQPPGGRGCCCLQCCSLGAGRGSRAAPPPLFSIF